MEVYWTTAWANPPPTCVLQKGKAGNTRKSLKVKRKRQFTDRYFFTEWVGDPSLTFLSQKSFFLKDLTIFKIQFMVSVSVVTVWRFSSWLKTVLREAFLGGSRLCHALEKKTSPSSTSKCSSSAYLPGLLCLTQEQQHITVTSRFPWHFWTICLSMARNLFSMTKEYLSPSP